MAYAAVTAAFEDVTEADEVRIDVGLGILERVAHARLRREMDHRIELLAREERAHRRAIGDVAAYELELSLAREAREPRLLQANVVVIVQVVEAGDALAALGEPQGQGGADEASRAGDQDVHVVRLS